MRLRDRSHSGRRADARRPHGSRASAPKGAVFVATDPASSPGPPSTLSPAELVRAAWHAFPGFLTVFLVRTAFPNEHHRAWRAFSVARALALPLAACWAVELWRLRRVRRAPPRASASFFFARLADSFFARALRENERDRVHGTAWYLLGSFVSLSLYPCDVAALSICALAFCDPAASLVGRSSLFRDARRNRRFANGKSAVGAVACFAVGVLTTWSLFRPRSGVFSVAAANANGRASSSRSDDEDESARFVILFGVVVGVVVAVVEFVGSKTFVDDNALIPVLVGAAAWPARGALLGWA